MKNLYQSKALKKKVVALALYCLFVWMINSSNPNDVSSFSIVTSVVIGAVLVLWVYKANTDKR